MTPVRELEQLLLSMFSAFELRSIVRYGPRGNAINQGLPDEGVSLARLASAIVEALVANGLVNDDFWKRLLEERPFRSNDIKRVQQIWAEAKVSPGAEPPVDPGAVPKAPETASAIRVLILSSNPDPNSPLAVDKEYRRIAKNIEATRHRDRAELITWPDAYTTDLPRKLRPQEEGGQEPHVVVFTGHSTPEGHLVMRNMDGVPASINPDFLINVLGRRADYLRLVVLNACWSKDLAQKLVQKIDCVTGINTEIEDRAAIVFSATLFEALFDGSSIDSAFEDARNAVLGEGGSSEHFHLHCREGVDPKKWHLVQKK